MGRPEGTIGQSGPLAANLALWLAQLCLQMLAQAAEKSAFRPAKRKGQPKLAPVKFVNLPERCYWIAGLVAVALPAVVMKVMTAVPSV
jgi:hypothetical protein